MPRFVNNRTLQQTTCAMSKDTADANATCTFCLIQPNCTKKCVYKYRKRHYKRIFKKIIVVFTFIFLQNENLNNKKETCCLTFSALEKIFSRGLFLTFCTVICPLHTGIGRGFCCKLFASGNGQARRINNTLRRPSDKNLYCKIVFTCFAKRQNCIFPEFVFDFLHCNLPFAHGNWQRVFIADVCLGNGQARHINNILHRTYDKNRYCKNCLYMFCKSDKICIFPEFVFDFLHGSLPLPQGLAEVFFVANCLPQVTASTTHQQHFTPYV